MIAFTGRRDFSAGTESVAFEVIVDGRESQCLVSQEALFPFTTQLRSAEEMLSEFDRLIEGVHVAARRIIASKGDEMVYRIASSDMPFRRYQFCRLANQEELGACEHLLSRFNDREWRGFPRRIAQITQLTHLNGRLQGSIDTGRPLFVGDGQMFETGEFSLLGEVEVTGPTFPPGTLPQEVPMPALDE